MARNTRSFNDERLTKEREVTQEREITADREMSDAQRLEVLRAANWQETLPQLPPRPGKHVCWLTTTNPRDPIHGRLRLGYRLIRANEIPGWEHSTLSTGDYAGYIGVNEMVAAEISLELYKAYMRDVHHDQPNAEEGRLNAVIDTLREQAASNRLNVELGEGTEEMARGKNVRPIFEGVD